MIDGHTHVLICGDFNFPNIDWSLVAGDNSHTHAFVETIQDKILYQHVCGPTRYRPNAIPHILDLVLTNEENMVNNLQYLPGLGLSDHVCLRFNLTCYSMSSTYSKLYFDLRSADFIKMRHLLGEIDWHTNLQSLNTLEAWDFLLVILSHV